MTLLPCPNPECVPPTGPDITSAHVRLERLQGPATWHARCAFCFMRGPHAANKAEALRLWNALPREEPWIAIDETLAKRARKGIPCVDVAFLDGHIRSTVADVTLRCDWDEWYAVDRSGSPILLFLDHRKTPTHYRKHVPPRHPLKDKP